MPPNKIWGQWGSPDAPHQAWVGRDGCLHLAQALHPRVISDPCQDQWGQERMGWDMRTGMGTGNGQGANQVTVSLPLPQGQPPVLRLSDTRFVPKTSPCVLPEPRGWVGHPWDSRGHRVGAATHGCYSALLTPPERFPQISQTCWNCHSSQFWRCRRIPAKGSPPGSVMVMGRAGGVSLGTRHTTGHLQG